MGVTFRSFEVMKNGKVEISVLTQINSPAKNKLSKTWSKLKTKERSREEHGY